MRAFSLLQLARLTYKTPLPPMLQSLNCLAPNTEFSQRLLDSSIQTLFPLTQHLPAVLFELTNKTEVGPLNVGVVFSGGPAPGGHNVVCGLFDALLKLNQLSHLIGFQNGPSGIINNQFITLDEEKLRPYRNQGGFDLLGTGRTKLETTEQFEAVYQTTLKHDLHGLIIIGGDDSNTNAAFLAEYLAQKQSNTAVIGIPKTIDGDLKNEYIDISFGFDTASKVYAEEIGNLMRDALSTKKYYFFVKIMGRSASHLTLECALQTQPNLALISEEVVEERRSLYSIVDEIADLIAKRASLGKDYGVILIPEGIIEALYDFKTLIEELNHLYHKDPSIASLLQEMEHFAALKFLQGHLSSESFACLSHIPDFVQQQILLERDPHGNIPVSQIETERMFIDLVEKRLIEMRLQSNYKGKFSAQPFFCGYEGRSSFPTNFDCLYCTSLGALAALMVFHKLNGYMACIQNLADSFQKWELSAVPLCRMIHIELRGGKKKGVIKKYLVDLEKHPFLHFSKLRHEWKIQDAFLMPGPIQFNSTGEKSIIPPKTLTLLANQD